MDYFIFKGVESSEFGVIVENPVDIVSGAIRAEVQKVVGSSRVLHYTEGDDVMDPITIEMDCAMLHPEDDTIDELCAWLRGGGKLVTPAAPDFYYNAWIKNQIEFAKILRVRPDRRFVLTFECEPFRYFYPERKALKFNTPGRLGNPGTAPAEPLIWLYGTGDNTLMIGDSSLIIDDMTDYVMIDCDAQIMYREDINLGAKLTRVGDWPRIPPEGCMINWTGGITRLEITPRWRNY